MPTTIKAYTFLPKVTADASEVNRNFDDLYGLVNGSLDSANIAAGVTLNACQISIVDSTGAFSETTVEGALNELNHRISAAVGATLQEYSEGLIGNIGSASQQFAGHIWTNTPLGYTACELVALYNFGNGVLLLQDENSAYTLVAGSVPPVCAAGIFGSNNAVSFTGNNSGNILYNATLLDSPPTAIAIDFWMESVKCSGSSQYIFYKANAAGEYIDAKINSGGDVIVDVVISATNIYKVQFPMSVTSATIGFNYYCINYDTANGLRVWQNGVIGGTYSGCNIANYNKQLSAGTLGDFFLGNGLTISGSYSFNGRLGQFRIRNKVLRQEDIDIAYSIKYSRPSTPTGNDINIVSTKIQNSNSSILRPYDINEYIVALDSSNIYRAGGYVTGLSASDRLKIILRGQ